MPHPAHPDPAAAALVAGHPGDLPARRGYFGGRRLDQGAEYRLAKVRAITWCEPGKCSHARSVSFCPSEPVIPRESPWERAREGHELRSPGTGGVPLSQDMREWVSRRVGGLAGSTPGAGVHVEHPAAERHGPLPLVCYAFAADVAGYPRSW